MRKQAPRCWIFVMIIQSAIAIGAIRLEAQEPEEPQSLSLPDLDGKMQSVLPVPAGRLLVLMFYKPTCPITDAYMPAWRTLQDDYDDRGPCFRLIAIGDESDSELIAHKKSTSHDGLALVDRKRALPRRFGVTTTSQVVVIDDRQRVRYTGRIDDRWASRTQRRVVTSHDLRNALEAVLAGKEPPVASTPCFGCIIGEPAPATSPTTRYRWNEDIEPLVRRRCQSCHHDGGSAPFALQTRDDFAVVAHDALALVKSGKMPPWLEVGPLDRFKGDRRLTEPEKQMLADWVEGDMPRGDPAKTPAPAKWPTTWSQKPDKVISTERSFELAAEGPDDYVWFVIPTGLVEDRFLAGVEFRPQPAEVVHHMLAYADVSGTALKLDQTTEEPGYRRFGDPGFNPDATIGAWAPGTAAYRLPPGYGRRIRAGSDLVVQVHFTRRGRPVEFKLDIGLCFVDGPTEKEVVTISLRKSDILIPPDAARHVEALDAPVPLDVEVLALGPHMHYLGREFRISVVEPGEKPSELLRIDDWDFNWQSAYVFPKPRFLKTGSKMQVEVVYDNSSENPLNPHRPPREVRWGPDATDEMLLLLLDVAFPGDPRIQREDLRRYLGLDSR